MPSGLSEFAEVAIPVAVHGTFTYAIPPELRDAVRLGSRVEVPFGAKRNTGFVVGLSDAADRRIRPRRAAPRVRALSVRVRPEGMTTAAERAGI